MQLEVEGLLGMCKVLGLSLLLLDSKINKYLSGGLFDMNLFLCYTWVHILAKLAVSLP